MYRWIRNEGPIINAGNLGEIGRAIHGYIEALDFKSAEKAWESEYFWTTAYQTNWRQSRVAKIYVLAVEISDGAVLQVLEMGQPSGLLSSLVTIKPVTSATSLNALT